VLRWYLSLTVVKKQRHVPEWYHSLNTQEKIVTVMFQLKRRPLGLTDRLS